MIESILLSAARIETFDGQVGLTNASGFLFERDGRLYLVTSRHVIYDAPSKHYPTRLQIELHTDPRNQAATTGWSMPVYRDGTALWRQGTDSAGDIDVAVLEIDRTALPAGLVIRPFTPEHLLGTQDDVEIGSPLLIVGFPLGFHDTLNHMPVARQAIIASSFGLRFQGNGYFLTDARTHRGTSGSPVVMRVSTPSPERMQLPWILLGVHSARLDVGTRDVEIDEALGLNIAWYADILMTLTDLAANR